MVTHQASGNKIDNIMVESIYNFLCIIKHHSGSPIAIGKIIYNHTGTIPFLLAKLIDK